MDYSTPLPVLAKGFLCKYLLCEYIVEVLSAQSIMFPYKVERKVLMETRLAIVGIMVYSPTSVERINELLHQYSQYIMGRMGMPYQEKKVSVISIIMDAPNDVIGAMTGKLGMIPDVNVKTIYSRV